MESNTKKMFRNTTVGWVLVPAANFIVILAKIKSTEAVDVILESAADETENNQKTSKKNHRNDGLVEDPFGK